MTSDDISTAEPQPDAPWLRKKDRASGKITSNTKTSMLVAWFGAFVWNLISALVWFAARHDVLSKASRWSLLLLLIPAVGLLLILAAVVSTLRWRKYGQSVFKMASVPGVIGGQFAGVIRLSAKVQPEDGFHLALNCLERVTTGTGKSRSTWETVLWQDEQLIARDLLQNDPERTAIPVLFQIPYQCRPTDEANASRQTIWRLDVSAKTPGLDYSTSFDVPVFKTAESDPNFVVDRSLIAEYTAPESSDRDLHEAGLRKVPSPTGEGFRLVFPMARNPVQAGVSALAGLVFSGAPFVLQYMDSGFSFTTIAFAILFGGVGLLLLAISVDSWFYRSAVNVLTSGLAVTGGLFGLGRGQWIDASQIIEIKPVSRMSSGDKVWYDLVVVCGGGKRITAGKRLLGKRLAESVIHQIEQAMGKPSPPSAS